jgi:hypothetical protein
MIIPGSDYKVVTILLENCLNPGVEGAFLLLLECEILMAYMPNRWRMTAVRHVEGQVALAKAAAITT